MKNTLKTFLIWRLLLFIPIIIGFVLLNYRSGYGYTNILNIEKFNVFQIIYSQANFDGVRYLEIAQRGYITEGAFFPLFPLLIKIVSFGSNNLNILFWTSLLVSNASALAGLFFLIKLLKLDYPKSVTKRTLLYVLIFPTAFFLGMAYSESIFLMLLVLSFYMIRRERWGWAMLFSTFLCATRLVGVFIVPVLFYEYWLKHGFGRRIWFFLSPAISNIIYALYCHFKWGDYLYFLRAHGQLGNGRSTDSIILFPQTIYRYFKILTTISYAQYEWGIAFIELLIFIIVLMLFVKACKDRIRVSYLIFSLPAFLLPSLSGTLSGLPRYVLILFPVFLSAALSKSRILRIMYILVGIILQFILIMLFSRGYYVA